MPQLTDKEKNDVPTVQKHSKMSFISDESVEIFVAGEEEWQQILYGWSINDPRQLTKLLLFLLTYGHFPKQSERYVLLMFIEALWTVKIHSST